MQGYWGNAKPPPGTTVDWSHHLARGICTAFAFNENAGAPVDSVRGVKLTPSTVTSWGSQGLRCDSTTDGADVLAPSYLKLGFPITIACKMIVLGAPTASAAFWGVDYDGAAGGAFVSYLLMDGGGGGKLQLARNQGGVYQGLISATDVMTPHYGKSVTAVGVLTAATTSLYLNGARVASETAGAAPTYSTARLIAGMYPGTSRNANIVLELGLVAQAAWTGYDAQAFHAQPYAMFAPPVWRRMFIPQAAAGGGTIPRITHDYRRRRVA